MSIEYFAVSFKLSRAPPSEIVSGVVSDFLKGVYG